MNLDEKIKVVQNLINRPGSDGEREAALAALERLQQRKSQRPKRKRRVWRSYLVFDSYDEKIFLMVFEKFKGKLKHQGKQQSPTGKYSSFRVLGYAEYQDELFREHNRFKKEFKDFFEVFITLNTQRIAEAMKPSSA